MTRRGYKFLIVLIGALILGKERGRWITPTSPGGMCAVLSVLQRGKTFQCVQIRVKTLHLSHWLTHGDKLLQLHVKHSFDHNYYSKAEGLTKELTRLEVTQASESSLWILVEAGRTHRRCKPKTKILWQRLSVPNGWRVSEWWQRVCCGTDGEEMEREGMEERKDRDRVWRRGGPWAEQRWVPEMQQGAGCEQAVNTGSKNEGSKSPWRTFSSLLAAGFPLSRGEMCCHASQRGLDSSGVFPHQTGAGLRSFLGKMSLCFISSQHSSQHCSFFPTVLIVWTLLIPHSKQENSEYWVFLGQWKNFSAQLSGKLVAKPLSSASKISARSVTAVVILYSDTFDQVHYLWS